MTKKTLTIIGLAIVAIVIVGLVWSAFRVRKPVVPVVPNTPIVKTYPACEPDQIAYRQGKKECECGGRFEFWDDGNSYCRQIKG